MSQPQSARTAVLRLVIARAISIAGGTAAFTALMFTVFEKTDESPYWLSATLVATFGATGVFGLFAGALGDRFDRRWVLIWSDVAGAAVYLAMVPLESPLALVGFGFFAAVAESPFWSASGAAIPSLVDRPEDIDRANSWVAVGVSTGIFLGPMIGGFLVDAVGSSWVFAGNAVTFLVSALLVFSIRRPFRTEGAADAGTGEHQGILAGIRFIRREPVLRRIIVAFMIMVMFIGLVMVSDLPLVKTFYPNESEVGTLYGSLIAAWGLGSIVGSLFGRFMTARTEFRWLILANVAFAATMGLVGVSPLFWPILVFLALNGTADGISIVAIRGVQQRRAPEAVRSRVMASTDALLYMGIAVGYVAAGPVLVLIGPKAVYLTAGVGALIGTAILLPLWGSGSRTEAEPATTPALLE